MYEALLELQIILGVFFWLTLHPLVVLKGHRRHRQRWLERRQQKAKHPPLPG